MKKTLLVTSLLLLLAPATILTTIFLSTPSAYVRVQANGCFTARIDPSTISEGQSPVMVYVTDTCDPVGTRLGLEVREDACVRHASGTVVLSFNAIPTDDTYHMTFAIPTSSLGGGSYCVHTWTLLSMYDLWMDLTVKMPLPPTYTSTTFTYTYSASSPLPPPGAYFDFTLAFSPSSLTVTQGGTANYQILITYSNPSYSGTTITVVNVAGLGPGMNYQIIPSPAGLRISTSQSTPAGTYTITLVGSAMGVMHQTSASLTVQPAEQPFDFSILVSPLDRIVTPGGSVSYTVAVNLVAGTAQAVALSVPDVPAGVTATFSQTSGSPPFTSTLTVSVSQSASPGKYPLTVTGIGGGKTRTAPVALVVEASPDFRVEVDPPSQTVLQGQTASYSVHVVSLNGFNSQVSLMVSGLPAGVNGVFSVPSSVPDFSTTLTLTIPGNSPTGSFTLTVTGSGGGINRLANVVLVINPAAQTQSSQSTTQPGGGASTPSGLLDYIQQNSLLVIGLLGAIIILLGALALRARRPPYTPPYPPQPQPSSITCGGCGTQNPTSNEFCANCGQRLR